MAGSLKKGQTPKRASSSGNQAEERHSNSPRIGIFKITTSNERTNAELEKILIDQEQLDGSSNDNNENCTITENATVTGHDREFNFGAVDANNSSEEELIFLSKQM